MPELVDGDPRFMKRALTLASRGRGRTSPNPMVGAVVVLNGRIVGEGYHLFVRKDHAEVIALRNSGAKSVGADLYVSLEPCCHRGRTPPCVDVIAASGLRRVFIALPDPDPRVSGRGIEALRGTGLGVHIGLFQDEARRLNEVFFTNVIRRRPFVLLKQALSLDGRIATSAGDSKWITGQDARRLVQRLRFEHDAVLVGIRTLLADDPSLNARWRIKKRVAKVVLDSKLKTPPDARIFESGDPVVLIHGPGASLRRRRTLGARAALIESPMADYGLEWRSCLSALFHRGLKSVLIEGGGKVAASALRTGIVDKVAFFLSPLIIGEEGLPAVGPLQVQKLQQSIRLTESRLRRIGEDFLVLGYPVRRRVERPVGNLAR